MQRKERKKYRESIRMLRLRLAQLEQDKSPQRESINEVAIKAVRDALADIGRKLTADWWSEEGNE